MNETLGQYLRRKREAHLISVQEISHSTGISVPMINALEEDKFHLIPRPEVTLQYLKKYAAYVSLDKKDILNRYKTQCARNHQKEYSVPHLSIFFKGEKLPKSKRRTGRLSKKQIMEGIFWAGIVIWAVILLYLYVHVLSLKKTGMLDIQEIMPSKETMQQASLQRNALTLSVTSEKHGNSPQRSSPGTSPGIVPVPIERHAGIKELSSQASHARQLSGMAEVMGNRKSRLYHKLGMKYYLRVRSYNRIVFNSEVDAITAGYRKAPEQII
jgi:cytoskeletal protein RodZ